MTAEYTNGETRDVTDYLSWSQEPLTADDTEFELRYERVLYQNGDGATGVAYHAPSVLLQLQINGEVDPATLPDYLPGDVDGDGRISAADARLALRRSVGLEAFEEGSAAFLACDVDFDGAVSSADARLILRGSVGLEDPNGWIRAQDVPID